MLESCYKAAPVLNIVHGVAEVGAVALISLDCGKFAVGRFCEVLEPVFRRIYEFCVSYFQIRGENEFNDVKVLIGMSRLIDKLNYGRQNLNNFMVRVGGWAVVSLQTIG